MVGHVSSYVPNMVNASKCWRWNVTSRELGERLVYFNMTPRKSMTLVFPTIEELDIRSFTRGLIDGDGSIAKKFNNSKTPTLAVSFCSASQSFIEPFHKFLKDVSGSNSSINKNRNMYNIRYVGLGARNIAHFLYDASSEHNRMTRKFVVANEFLR